ncbi:hypothetical protein V8C40DRAFT_279811 [Trichoderma camerunense]
MLILYIFREDHVSSFVLFCRILLTNGIDPALLLIPPNQLLVYQTCRPLCAIIHRYFLAGKGDILVILNGRLNYLTHLTRSLPDRWVCSTCFKLHQTYSWDAPASRLLNYPKCGDGEMYVLGEHTEAKIFFNEEFSPAHRCRTYAQRSFYPKVVDGRYLLLTVHTYLGVGAMVSRQSVNYLKICSHLISLDGIIHENELKLKFAMIIYAAFSAPPDTRILFPCLACGTDLSIRASKERLVICLWHDLGPEGTVYDPDWGAIVRQCTTTHHRIGSIRELYGQHEHNDEIC